MVPNIDSSRVDLLERLKEVTQDAIKDLILPVRIQREGEDQSYRSADVYLMRLPDSKSATKKAPYIIHQLITGRDMQEEGQRVTSTAQVRSIFCVYSDDEQEGSLMLLGLMERLRIKLLKQVVIGERYQLDLTQAAEALIYPDDTAPYFAGEMVTTWKIPSIEREVRQWL
jgi:hypothetical protein